MALNVNVAVDVDTFDRKFGLSIPTVVPLEKVALSLFSISGFSSLNSSGFKFSDGLSVDGLNVYEFWSDEDELVALVGWLAEFCPLLA